MGLFKFAFACALLAITNSMAHAADSDLPHWKPGKRTIAKVDFAFRNASRWRGSPPDIAGYDRYYAGITINGRRRVSAEFAQAFTNTDCIISQDKTVHPFPPVCLAKPRQGEVYVVPEERFPSAKGGGCSFIYLLYDVDAERMIQLDCNAPA